MTNHTIEALRAANAIRLQYRVLFNCPLEMLAESIAFTIDKETALPALLAENARLREALQCAEAEMVTLLARLSEPYRSNIKAACDKASAALAVERSDKP